MDATRLFDSGFGLLAQATASPVVTTATPVTATPTSGGLPGWALWLITLAIIAGSYYLASSLAKSWRMYDYTGRFFAIIFSTAVGIAILLLGWPPKLGIDLSGGHVLVYRLDQVRLEKTTLDENDALAVQSVLTKLLKSENVSKIPAVKLSEGSKDRITIDIEGIPLGLVEQFDRVLVNPDVLSSGANLQKYEQTAKKLEYQLHRGLNQDVMSGLVAALTTRINPGGQKEIKIKPFGDTAVEIIIPNAEPAEIATIKQKLGLAGTLEFRILANAKFRDHKRLVELAKNTEANLVIDPRTATPLGKWVPVKEDELRKLPPDAILRPGRAGRTEALVHYHEDLPVVTGKDLRRATGGPNTDAQHVGEFQVSFILQGPGARNFGKLTHEYTLPSTLAPQTPAQLAILIDNEIYTAPNLQTEITSGEGRITGSNFTESEVKLMATVLNSGSLPAALDKTPIQEESISAQLGEDTIKSGGTAMAIATAAILLFMLWFYGFCGFVADIAVVLNIMLVVALMIAIKAAFTLAGLAGLVLSVGMAVDANVLIFERMREEVQRGSALKMAIRNGFGKAMSTVIDSNLTTLISGVVLFAIGTEQLKGFATTLILGLLLNLFTAVYCSRIIFDVAEKRGWLRKLNMRAMIGETKFDFVRPVKVCVVFSCIVLAAGLVLAGLRGENFFDIDFTGGSTVQIVLKEDEPELNIAQVREIVGDKLEDLEVSQVYGAVPSKQQKFKIVTSEQDLVKTKEALSEAFGNKLERYTMTVANVGPYVPPKPVTPPATKETDTKAPATTEPADKDAAAKDSTTKESGAKEPDSQSDSPAKQEPAKEETGKEPAATDPATKEPAATEPLNPSPAAKATEAATEAAKDAAKDAPAKAEPAKTEPAKEEPTKKQSQWRRSNEQWLALAATNPLASLPLWQSGLLLQEDGKKEPAKDAPTKQAEPTKSTEPAQATDPAKATDPAPSTEPAKSAEPPAATDPAKATDPATPADPAKTAEPMKSTEPASTDPAKSPEALQAEIGKLLGEAARGNKSDSNYKSSADLTFSTEVSKQYLTDLSTALLEELNKQPETKITMRDYDFLNPKGNTDETAIYKTWTMVSSLEPAELRTFVDKLSATISSQPVFSQLSNVGGEVASGTQSNAIWALVVSCLAIVLYVWFRFQNLVFGFAAVIALIHDVLFTIGALAVSSYIAPTLSSIGLGWLGINPFKISLEVVAALLTIIGFSINDTIVIFDRIRELRGKSPDLTKEIVNKAVNQTLGRTILTSGTVFIVTCILYFFGGEEIHPFSFAMLVGLISGTYSTVFIAAPIVLWFRKREAKATSMSNYTGVKSMTSR